MKRVVKRLIWVALALIAAAGVAASQYQVNFLRPRIERALERGLGRKVDVGEVYFNVFTGPGFTIDSVTIYEDPRAGIEPFAYVGSLEARVRLLSLFSRHLEFSSLRLGEGPRGEQTSINLVKTGAGPWNFQFLLGGAPRATGALPDNSMPDIKMRGGRVNFKFGDTKSVFYFNDTDLDVSSSESGVELRFSGAPSRTDQAAQNFGHFFVRGKWSGGKLDMRVELEKSAVEEVARLLDRHGFGLHGVVAFAANLDGPPSKLDVTGQLQVDDVHRWDLLPKRGGGWSVAYQGTLDLHGERLDLASVPVSSDAPPGPLALEFRAWDLLSTPRWDASAQLRQFPLAVILEVARHMGAALSDSIAAEGSVSGTVRYSAPDGLSGRVDLQDASVALPNAEPLRAESAAVTIGGTMLSLESCTVKIGESESAEIEGSFDVGDGLDLRIDTRGLNVADLRSFGLGAIPLLEQTPQGVWRGWARYRWPREEPGEWSGEYELQNARVAIPGMADPLRIQSAAVSSNGKRISVSRLRARIGQIAFTGDYRWEPAALRPNKFHIAIARADAAELERLFAPALIRERGFLARTLRLGPAPAPDWLKSRRADGTVSIDALAAGDTSVHLDAARVLWDGTLVRLARLSAHVDDAALSGELAIDLAGRVPHYRFDGKLAGVSYRGGLLDFDGSLEADGADAQLIASAHAEGSLRGRGIAFAPDADFRSVAGCFDLLPGARWRVSCLEVSQGGETYTGAGTSQPDGRIVLDLSSHGRPVHYTSAALPPSQF